MSSSPTPSDAPSSNQHDDVHAFIRRTTQFVSVEREAELSEETQFHSCRQIRELEQAGVLLTRLSVTEVSTGLYGRCLLTLESTRGGPIPQSELGVRDIVELASQSAASGGGGGSTPATSGRGTKLATGVVYRLKEKSITIVLDQFIEPTERVGQMSLLKLANQVSE